MIGKTKKVEVYFGCSTKEFGTLPNLKSFEKDCRAIFNKLSDALGQNGGTRIVTEGRFEAETDVMSKLMIFYCKPEQLEDLLRVVKLTFKEIKPIGVNYVCMESSDAESHSFAVGESSD